MRFNGRLDRIEEQLGETDATRRVRVVVLRRGESAEGLPAGVRVIRQGPPDPAMPDDVRADLAAGRPVKLFAGFDPAEVV